MSDIRSTQDAIGGDTVRTTNSSAHIVDPTIRALETSIEASAETLLQGDDTALRQGLLVLSSWHESMPALVHLDPILEPVDSRVFSVLWIWARQHGRGATAFPSYDYLLQRSNIQGRATLSRALTILRITRWITLCRRVRDPAGRNRGNIYALHEEPLALVNTLYLDPSYMDFLDAATRHHHDQVRHLARAMLESLQTRIDGGEDVLEASPLTPIDQRIEAIETIVGEGTGHYFGFHLKTLASLQDWRWRSKTGHPASEPRSVSQVQKLNPAQVQNLNSDSVQNLNSALCSSYLIKPTTTLQAQQEFAAKNLPPSKDDLIFPESLSANECRLAQMYLRGVDAELHQALLDELAEKMRRYAKTDHRVRNPIGLLCWMCNEAKAGQPPLTSDSIHLRERRERDRQLAEREAAACRRLTDLALKQGAARHGLHSAPAKSRGSGGDSVTTQTNVLARGNAERP